MSRSYFLHYFLKKALYVEWNLSLDGQDSRYGKSTGAMTTFQLNGHDVQFGEEERNTPLIYVLRGPAVGDMTPKLGCGLEQCGACRIAEDDSLATFYGLQGCAAAIALDDIIVAETRARESQATARQRLSSNVRNSKRKR